LVQWDASEHDWLESRGPKLYLISMIDDATSRLHARFVLHDSTAENMRLLLSDVELHGRPLSFYTDKAGLFQTALKIARDLLGSIRNFSLGRDNMPLQGLSDQLLRAKRTVLESFRTRDHTATAQSGHDNDPMTMTKEDADHGFDQTQLIGSGRRGSSYGRRAARICSAGGQRRSRQVLRKRLRSHLL
jgi:hypothetical protein